MMHKGSCHCGKISFEVEAPADLEITECNCSICSKTGLLHLIVEKDNFKLLTGESQLENYQFDTGEASHYFCKTCGIRSFYIPRSHPNGVSVNARCIDGETVKSMIITPFDGQNWDENIEALTAK